METMSACRLPGMRSATRWGAWDAVGGDEGTLRCFFQLGGHLWLKAPRGTLVAMVECAPVPADTGVDEGHPTCPSARPDPRDHFLKGREPCSTRSSMERRKMMMKSVPTPLTDGATISTGKRMRFSPPPPQPVRLLVRSQMNWLMR